VFTFRFKNIRFTVEEGASLVFEMFVRFGPNNQAKPVLLCTSYRLLCEFSDREITRKETGRGTV